MTVYGLLSYIRGRFMLFLYSFLQIKNISHLEVPAVLSYLVVEI